MFMKGDFHVHSTASDGELSPRDIIITAKKRGIDIISLADHNSTDGIEEAVKAGKEFGVAVIPGVELSTRYKNESIHILGYFTNESYKDSDFQEVLKLVRSDKIKKARSILRSLMNTNATGDALTVVEGIFLLKAFEAAAVLAHPVRINKKYLTEILNMPFDGIEAKYCINSDFDTSYFINKAQECFTFYTCGSDFHTDKSRDTKHCFIGEPCLNSAEIQLFLKKSGVIVYC